MPKTKAKANSHGGPEVLLTTRDYDPWDTSVYDASEPGSQHEVDIAEMPLSEDGTISCHSFTDAFEQSKGHQNVEGVLYIC